MVKRAARVALVCALVGFGASVASAYTHYHLLFDPTYRSFCDVNATFSCSQVLLSRFGTVRGIPVAIFGALWFGVAGLLSVVGMRARDSVRESVPGYLFVLSTLALSVILYLAYASLFLLQAVCVLCLTTYAAVIGLFLVSGAATSFPMTTLPGRISRDLRVLVRNPLAVTLAVLFFAGAVTTLAFFPREGGTSDRESTAPPTQDQRSELERFMATAPRVPLVISAEGAKVLIVKFNDYQCPACGQSFLSYKPILAKYEQTNPGAVRIVMKDYPLNPNCNTHVAVMLHASACDAAVAVRLASARNHGPEMEEWLYTHQPTLTPPIVRQAAHDVGQVNDFDAKYQPTLELVKGDIALGVQLGVRSTPTFFINGVKVEGAWQPQYFDQAIAYELQHAPSK
jgi:uncharacterized membrane protein/protein-disulfide isomerase